MSFLTELEVKPAMNNCWELTAPLDYGFKDLSRLRVPRGFVTDLASIPRPLRLVVPVNGYHRAAAVLHDRLYEKKGRVRLIKGVKQTAKTFTRLECDQIFLHAMKECGVSWWKRHSMYWAVRAGGWVIWKGKAKS